MSPLSLYRQLSSPYNKTKNTPKKTVLALIMSKTLINQTGVNSPSDFSDNDNDWQTVPPWANQTLKISK